MSSSPVTAANFCLTKSMPSDVLNTCVLYESCVTVPHSECEAASVIKSSKTLYCIVLSSRTINLKFLLPNQLGLSLFLVKKGLLCNLGLFLQESQVFQFDWPKVGCVQAKTMFDRTALLVPAR